MAFGRTMRRSGTIAATILSAILLVQAGLNPVGRTQDQLIRTAEQAVNDSDLRRVEAVTASGVSNDYRWIKDWPASGPTSRRWRAAILQSPDGTPTDPVLLGISRPQVCQSTSDHLYRLQTDANVRRLGSEIVETDPLGIRFSHHTAEVRFRPDVSTVDIIDRAQVHRCASPLSYAVFRLNEYYSISSIEIDGVRITFKQSGGFVAIPALQRDKSLMTLRYRAILPSKGESYSTPSEAALTAYWLPHSARLPATSTITTLVPEDWRGIAPGRAVSSVVAGGLRRTTWQNDLPVSYISVAAGRYREYGTHKDGLTVSAWALRATPKQTERILETTANAIRWFSARFGPFPYRRYTVVESSVFPYGLEGYSFTICGSQTLPDIIPHEVSHTWWGGLLPNAYTRSLWNESLASYSERLYERQKRGSEAMESDSGAQYEGRNLPNDPPLDTANNAMHPGHYAIGYKKGALVLEQLERYIGSERMLATLRAFLAARIPGTAVDWPDFVAALRKVNGPEHGGFLDEWLRSSGLPEYALGTVTAVQKDGDYLISGTISTSSPVRWCLLPVVVRTSGEPVVANVRITGSEKTPFEICTKIPPTEIELDPDGIALRKDGRVKQPINRL